jgi:hypothetical protein
MWHWIRRWLAWRPMRDLWSMHRSSPQPQALHYRFEKAGLTLHEQPIPWNAEAVLVEALLRLPPAARRKADFTLRLPGVEPVAADSLRREEADDRFRLTFRLPPPARTSFAEVFWHGRSLGSLTLPVLGAEEFLANLRLHMPTLFVRLAEQSVACTTFVSTQCRGMLTSALLRGATSLAPLTDLGLHVEFRCERSGAVCDVPVPLCGSQLAGREALVTAVPRRFPRRMGSWTATWLVGDRVLATHRVRAISQRLFQKSLRVVDSRFVVQTEKEGINLRRQVPPLPEIQRAGPCFLVGSREPGMAGFCTLQVHAQVPGSVSPPALLEQTVLITDGPTLFTPGTLDAEELAQVSAFELRLKGQVLGVASLCPVPVANFTSEGGFRAPADFVWTTAAEEELGERLSRLMDGRATGA